MAEKKPGKSKLPDSIKYFVPAPGNKTAPESPRTSDAGAKYYVPPPAPKRTYPLPSELAQVWNGTGPDLPYGYENAEACPDCSAFRFASHAPLCIRNPGAKWNRQEAWNVVRAREQIFFGAGHPITHDVDAYMTMDRQRKLTRASYVVLYDYPAEGSRVKTLMHPALLERAVIVEWRRNGKI